MERLVKRHEYQEEEGYGAEIERMCPKLLEYFRKVSVCIW